MPTTSELLHHIAENSARLRRVLLAADPEAPVPTCPGWTATDLLWHLTEVQGFWARVVEQRCAEPSQLTGEDLLRPSDQAALADLAEAVTAHLLRVLEATPPVTPVWTWSDDHSAGFVLRRQAHEALVHRVDAEHVGGDHTPLDPTLAADGVDEALRVMLGGCPPWAELAVDEQATVRLATSDTADSWVATLARFSGTDPQGQDHAGATLLISAEDHELPTTATVTASAGDLDCWLWGRPTLGAVELRGDVHTLAGLREVVSAGVQ